MYTFNACTLLWIALRLFCCRTWNLAALPVFPASLCSSVELLAIKIRDCKDFNKELECCERYTYMKAVVKIALYADDITLFLQTENEMSNALSIMEGFSRISGLEINKTKSESHVAW